MIFAGLLSRGLTIERGLTFQDLRYLQYLKYVRIIYLLSVPCVGFKYYFKLERPIIYFIRFFSKCRQIGILIPTFSINIGSLLYRYSCYLITGKVHQKIAWACDWYHFLVSKSCCSGFWEKKLFWLFFIEQISTSKSYRD